MLSSSPPNFNGCLTDDEVLVFGHSAGYMTPVIIIGHMAIVKALHHPPQGLKE